MVPISPFRFSTVCPQLTLKIPIMSTRRPSRLKQSLSWLLKPQTTRPPTEGELGDDYEHIERESLTEESFLPLLSQGQNRIHRNMETPSTSRRHSLPEVGCAEGALAVSRPPPFFYSRRLSPMREPDGDSIEGEGVSVHDKEGDSNVSIASSEIATWRHAVSNSALLSMEHVIHQANVSI